MSGAISEDQVKRFAAAWLLALDVHARVEECTRLVADSGLEMVFPERTLRGLADFVAWYAGGTYTDGTRAVGVINIFFDEAHNLHSVHSQSSGDQADVRVVLGWQASWFEPPAARSKRTSMEFIHRWILRRSDKNAWGLEILRYDTMAEPFRYAPGFAHLPGSPRS